MRNKIAIAAAVLLALLPLGACAQKYVVYSVVGKACTQQGKIFSPLSARKYLSPATKLKIAPESAVTVIDESKQKMFSFTRAGVNSVGDLVGMSSKQTKNLTKQYMGYLVKQLFGSSSKKMVHPDAYMQVTGTSYRAVAKDSLMAARLVEILDDGTSAHGTAEQQLFDGNNSIASDFDVSFDLVDVETGKTVGNAVRRNTPCYARVTNNTDETLYVNILNIDKDGNKYLVLPIDEEATCANLLVPAFSTVGFKSEPFITPDNTSDDAFVLVATEEPVNFSIMMNPLTRGSIEKSDTRVGVMRRNVKTE